MKGCIEIKGSGAIVKAWLGVGQGLGDSDAKIRYLCAYTRSHTHTQAHSHAHSYTRAANYENVLVNGDLRHKIAHTHAHMHTHARAYIRAHAHSRARARS